MGATEATPQPGEGTAQVLRVPHQAGWALAGCSCPVLGVAKARLAVLAVCLSLL